MYQLWNTDHNRFYNEIAPNLTYLQIRTQLNNITIPINVVINWVNSGKAEALTVQQLEPLLLNFYTSEQFLNQIEPHLTTNQMRNLFNGREHLRQISFVNIICENKLGFKPHLPPGI